MGMSAPLQAGISYGGDAAAGSGADLAFSNPYSLVPAAIGAAAAYGFSPTVRHYIHGQIGKTAFGVCCNSDKQGHFDYLCGVEVSDFWRLPSNFTHQRIAAQKYAVFSHREHISTIRSTLNTIWNKWLPESGLEVVDAPDFERYGEGFDTRTGAGGLEIWIPIKP